MHHNLKILPCFFKAVVKCDKTFEIRKNDDRGFQKGDTVALEEIEQGVVIDRKTGRAAHVEITYVTNYGQPQDQVVFSFRVIELFGV